MRSVRDVVSAPEDWLVESVRGFGPFTTRIEFRLPDGSRRVWRSRRQRKADPAAVAAGRRAVPRRTWWIAALFAVGSTCFALGSMPPYFNAVSARVDGLTFFVGSIFFTTASYLCFAEVAGTPDDVGPGTPRRLRLLSIRPHRIDWWATSVQLVGTVFFNITTFTALHDDWDATRANHLVWLPDAAGSVCFLVSSYLAWAEVCHGAGRLKFRDVSWWIVVLNLAGSVFFGVSAVASKFVAQGEVRNLQLTNAGTWLGAVCFLAGAVLLVPEARRTPEG